MRDNDGMEPSASSLQVIPAGRARIWKLLWIAIAVIIAIPIASKAYDRILQVNQESRMRLITEHRLWELHPEYRGKPETWTRFASRLLSDRQLMTRIAAKYGPIADQIEADYRRDMAIAQMEVALTAAAAWLVPLALLYGIGWVWGRRRVRSEPPVKIQPASSADPRYMKDPKSTDKNGGNE